MLVQRLLQGFGLDPIASLYYMAPVRAKKNRLRFAGTTTDRLPLDIDRSAWLSTPSSCFRSKVSVSSPTRWKKSASLTSSSSAL